jgi:hypothetical protein
MLRDVVCARYETRTEVAAWFDLLQEVANGFLPYTTFLIGSQLLVI